MTNLPSIREYEPMDRHTSWRAGGAARFYAEPGSVAEALALIAWAEANRVPLVWSGRGTNTLFRDEGFPGLIAVYRAQSWELEEQGDAALLRAEAGAPMTGLARRLSAMGWAGLEWAEGLPGTVGGAIFGNAGCYGSDTAATLVNAELLVAREQGEKETGGQGDWTVETWPVERLEYGYRSSLLKRAQSDRQGDRGQQPGAWSAGDEEHVASLPPARPLALWPSGPLALWPSGPLALWPSGPLAPSLSRPPLILAGTFRLVRQDLAALSARTAAIAVERKSKTPAGSSCGSVFKNPPGHSAGRLIEQAGLKGRQVGAAVISPVHANYIVNTGGATAADILGLVEIAQAAVREQFGIELELEVRVL